jgi:hypothetical protein
MDMAQRPVGTPNKPVTVILLTIVTLGIYGWIWAYRNFEQMKAYSGEGLGGGMGLLLYIFIVGIFLMPDELGKLYTAEGQQSPVSAVTGVWILVPFVGFIFYILKVQEALNTFWVQHGAAAPV